MKSNLPVHLKKSAKERPGKLAPILGDRVLAYTGLPAEVKKFANALTALGEKPLLWSI